MGSSRRSFHIGVSFACKLDIVNELRNQGGVGMGKRMNKLQVDLGCSGELVVSLIGMHAFRFICKLIGLLLRRCPFICLAGLRLIFWCKGLRGSDVSATPLAIGALRFQSR